MSTSAKATEMSTTIRVPQTTIQIPQTPISREPPMPTIMPSPTSTSTHVQVPVSNVMENPVIPSLVQVSTLTLDLVPTPTVSTKALNPTQAPYKKLQFSTEFLIIPTSAITSSTITGALTIDVSSQLPAATPTIKTTPNSSIYIASYSCVYICMCVYVCVCAFMYIHMRVQLHICLHTFKSIMCS